MTSTPAAVALPTGRDLPALLTAPPGPESRAWLARFAEVAAPMGPRPPAPTEAGADPAATMVYRQALGANVIDVDGNRFVDLAAGFGSLLLGHRPKRVQAAMDAQSGRLLQSLGDVHPSDIKIQLLERLATFIEGGGQGIIGQSGADALSAALKTAVLYTGRPGVVAFDGAYHGLSYGPLALCGLRKSYRSPFAEQLNPAVHFVEYPHGEEALDRVLGSLRRELSRGDVGAVVYEPILGRAGVVVPPAAFAERLAEACREFGSLLIADEVWTGLGRSGHWLFSRAQGVQADILCLGKGLGGGLPISACIGSRQVMAAWSRSEEVVHTSTFAGAPLACAAALETLTALEEQALVERSQKLGRELSAALSEAFPASWPSGWEVRGEGLMLGIDPGPHQPVAIELARELLRRGYIVSLGGGRRESLVLTPALDVCEALLDGFVSAFADALRAVPA